MLALKTASGNRWIKDIQAYTPDAKVDYPIIADADKKIATLCARLRLAPASSLGLLLVVCHPEAWLNSALHAVRFGKVASPDRQALVAGGLERRGTCTGLDACLSPQSCCMSMYG